MRKIFKAVVCTAVIFAFLKTCAFAALYGTITMLQDGLYSVSISGYGDNSEATILVYKGSVENGELPSYINASDIVYINQMTAVDGSSYFMVNTSDRAVVGDTLYVFAGGTNESSANLIGVVTIGADAASSESVSLNKNELTLTVGSSETLTVNAVLGSGTNPEVTWESSDITVAVVNNGVVTAVAKGAAVITAAIGENRDECTVTVRLPAESDSNIINVKNLIIARDSENNTAFADPSGKEYGSAFRITFERPIEATSDDAIFGLTVGGKKRYTPKQIGILKGISGTVKLDVSFLNGSTEIAPMEFKDASIILSDGKGRFFFSDPIDAENMR